MSSRGTPTLGQRIPLRDRLRGLPLYKLAQEVNMVLDGPLASMQSRINGLKKLIAKNNHDLALVKEEEKEIRTYLQGYMNEVTNSTSLTTEDMNFFNKLIFHRARSGDHFAGSFQSARSEKPTLVKKNPVEWSPNVVTKEATVARSVHLVKKFDDLFNNRNLRMEQFIDYNNSKPIEAKPTHHKSDSIPMGSDHMELANTKETIGEHQGDSINEDFVSSVPMVSPEAITLEQNKNLNRISSNHQSIKCSQVPSPQVAPRTLKSVNEVMAEYYKELSALGKQITKTTDSDIEKEGVMKGKSKTEILKDIRLMQKLRAEVEAKLLMVKDTLQSYVQAGSKPVNTEDLTKRLTTWNPHKNIERPPSTDRSEIPSGPHKILTEDGLGEFLNRNYSKFLTKYQAKLSEIEEEENKRKEALSRIPEIDTKSNLLSTTKSISKKKEEALAAQNSLKSARDYDKVTNSPLNYTAKRKSASDINNQAVKNIEMGKFVSSAGKANNLLASPMHIRHVSSFDQKSNEKDHMSQQPIVKKSTEKTGVVGYASTHGGSKGIAQKPLSHRSTNSEKIDPQILAKPAPRIVESKGPLKSDARIIASEKVNSATLPGKQSHAHKLQTEPSCAAMKSARDSKNTKEMISLQKPMTSRALHSKGKSSGQKEEPKLPSAERSPISKWTKQLASHEKETPHPPVVAGPDMPITSVFSPPTTEQVSPQKLLAFPSVAKQQEHSEQAEMESPKQQPSQQPPPKKYKNSLVGNLDDEDEAFDFGDEDNGQLEQVNEEVENNKDEENAKGPDQSISLNGENSVVEKVKESGRVVFT